MSISTTVELKELYPFLWDRPFAAEDRQFARYLLQNEGIEEPIIILAGACAVAASRLGHSFLDLENPPKELFANSGQQMPWPSIDSWKRSLRPYSETQERKKQIFVFEGGKRLYLFRYWEHERSLALMINERLSSRDVGYDKEEIETTLLALFDGDCHPTNKQYIAVLNALSKSLFVITGGPGTGKTTTVLKLIAAYLSLESSDPRIALVAPTGKAAARLQESILIGAKSLSIESDVRQKLPQAASTIHRLLGSRTNTLDFRHNRQTPLPHDLIIVDEASMIDLPLMRRFFEAVPASCRVILLGDPNQLTSVQVGSVLKDMVSFSDRAGSSFANFHTQLDKTYRFSDSSGIGAICRSIQNNSLTGFLDVFDKLDTFPDISYHEMENYESAIKREILADTQRYLEAVQHTKCPAEALSLLGKSQILSPTQIGEWGSLQLNSYLNDQIGKRVSTRFANPSSTPYFKGQPILVLENNYDFEVFNGDLGLIWGDASDELKAWFPSVSGTPNSLSISQLPRHETAFAITIHKSQGSEFDAVTVVLDSRSQIFLNRELLYTAISRAKKKLKLFASRETISAVVSEEASRATGLRDQLIEVSRNRQSS